MTLEELIDILESADMLRIFKGDEEIFVGYLALFAPEVGHTNCKLYEQYKNDKVIRFRAVPEITHRRWKELNLMSPLKPDEDNGKQRPLVDCVIQKSQEGVLVKFFVNDIESQKAFDRLCCYKGKFLRIYNYPKQEDKPLLFLHQSNLQLLFL